MSGGIIINHARILLTAATEPAIYNALNSSQKTAVDTIDAKNPASRTQDDVNRLLVILAGICGC